MGEALSVLLGGDPASAFAQGVAYLNLALSGAVLLVLALRAPLCRIVGPQGAYALWLLPVAALLGALVLFLIQAPETRLRVPAFPLPALAIWALGALAMAALFARAQARFEAELRAGRVGPAVVGLISPRLVLPADGRYTDAERELIRAHEREHIARKDTRAVAFAALLQCLFWYNPLVHVAAWFLRLDQELACDAGVVLGRPGARGLYARTLLKTQLAATPLPLGCYWPARSRHPLEVRLALLKPRGGGPADIRRAGRSIMAAPVDAIRP
jgi:beta-lactamase regulating signal transducer with metallopeptidase domain